MPTDDRQVLVAGAANAPAQFIIPGNGQIQPKVIRAVVDGSGATTVFIPVLRFVSDGGIPAGEFVGPQIAAGGSAAVSWFPHVAPTGTGGVKATGWVRTAVPLISPTAAWENGQVQEPTVRYESGIWKMWYTGGGANVGMGYTQCLGDPTIASNWTKSAGNPVLGQGGSGVAGFVSGTYVTKIAGTYQCFYYDALGGGNLKRTSSADGLAWAAPATAIAKGAVGGAPGGWANSTAWFDGANYWLFVEASTNGPGGPPWAAWLFKNGSITNDGGWVVQNGGNPLTTLQVAGYARGYGQGPNIAEIDGADSFVVYPTDTLWYHVQRQVAGRDTTDITHAYTIDPGFVTFTQSGVFDLKHSGTQYEFDQVADPCVLQVGGKSYLFYTGENSVSFAGYINLATFPDTLAVLRTTIG